MVGWFRSIGAVNIRASVARVDARLTAHAACPNQRISSDERVSGVPSADVLRLVLLCLQPHQLFDLLYHLQRSHTREHWIHIDICNLLWVINSLRLFVRCPTSYDKEAKFNITHREWQYFLYCVAVGVVFALDDVIERRNIEAAACGHLSVESMQLLIGKHCFVFFSQLGHGDIVPRLDGARYGLAMSHFDGIILILISCSFSFSIYLFTPSLPS